MSTIEQNKIVLGYPYWNAFYWLISAEDWRSQPLKSIYTGGHEYYQNLFQVKDLSIIDEVASLALLYDTIILSPADCYLPQNCDDLGILSSWNWYSEADKKYRSSLRFLLDHLPLSLTAPLSVLQRDNIGIILTDMVTQISLANDNHCAIIVGREYQPVYDWLTVQLQKMHSINHIPQASNIATGLYAIQSVTGLQFSLQSFQEFIELRKSKTIKTYGTALKSRLFSDGADEFSELNLLKSMVEAINTTELADKIGNGLSVTSAGLTVAGLIPFLGTITGIAGLVTAVGEKVADNTAKNAQYWAFYPEISKALSKRRIEQRYKELISQ